MIVIEAAERSTERVESVKERERRNGDCDQRHEGGSKHRSHPCNVTESDSDQALTHASKGPKMMQLT